MSVFWHGLCFFVPSGITQQFRFCGVMQNRVDFFGSGVLIFLFVCLDGQVICILPCDALTSYSAGTDVFLGIARQESSLVRMCCGKAGPSAQTHFVCMVQKGIAEEKRDSRERCVWLP